MALRTFTVFLWGFLTAAAAVAGEECNTEDMKDNQVVRSDRIVKTDYAGDAIVLSSTEINDEARARFEEVATEVVLVAREGNDEARIIVRKIDVTN